ncbi:CJH_07325 family protein [Campylobacter coli]|nr:CJH_07325 family protein [Campylobacter coli]
MEKLIKDIHRRVGFVNIPYFNVGNTCDTAQTTSNNELDKMLENLERDLIEDRKKFKMDEFFANAKF